MARAHDCLKPRAAQPVHGLSGNGVGESCKHCGHAGDIAIVLACLVGCPKDHVLDLVCDYTARGNGLAYRERGKVIWADST
jgi:hypothetical protein